MTDEMGAVAHQLGDVVGVTQEVVAVGSGTLAIAPPVEHHEAKALVGERPLGFPFFGTRCERAVHEHHGRAGAPRLDEEVAHRGPSFTAMLTGAPMILADSRLAS